MIRGEKKKKLVDVYVDQLGFLAALRLLGLLFRNRIHKVYFFSFKASASPVFALFKAIGNPFEKQKINLDLSSLMPEGGSLWASTHAALNEISEVITLALIKKETFLDFISTKIETKRKFCALRKLIVQEIYTSIVLMFLAHQRKEKKTPKELQSIVLVSLFDLLPFFKDSSIRWVPDIVFCNFGLGFLLLPSYFIKFLCCQLSELILGMLVPSGQKGKAEIRPPSVAAQYVWGIKSNVANDLWWNEDSRIDSSRVIFFF